MGSSSRSARGSGTGAASAAVRRRPAAGLVTIGRIVAPHGLRGEVRVQLDTDFPRRFEGLRDAYLVRGGRAEAVRVTGHRPHRGGVLLTLDGVDDLATAEALRGAAVAVARDAAVALGKDQFYVFEIIGLTVRTVEGRTLGTVTEVMRTPANDVYVARGEAGEWLIPAVRDVVRRIDVAAGEMIVALPDGLEAVSRAR
ncbi:MAG: ribosome maturation factor RimM [Armatimonadota bacterium]|nr:ribosome maturation factor RimM [Armatimonadota bacterium]